jgi:DNA-binding NtrC family response regulator
METEFIGTSPQALDVRERILGAAQCELPVLLLGETGTGKSFVAELIHCRSQRATGPFIPVDVGTIPPPLVHAELFGYRKGAYTGAQEPHAGLVRTANRGTLFLDEIANINPEVQACLLQFLDRGLVRPLGGDSSVAVDCRIIAATKENLEELVHRGAFREDLFWRLRGLKIVLPPLRERANDVLVIARRWLAAWGFDRVKLSEELQREMLVHPWPGNLRELRHRLRLAVARIPSGVLEVHDLGLPATDAAARVRGLPRGSEELVRQVLSGALPLERALAIVEREALARALSQTGGNLRRAAALLGIRHSSLRSKLSKHGMAAGTPAIPTALVTT